MSEHRAYGKYFDNCVSCGSRDIKLWKQKGSQYSTNIVSAEFSIFRCNCCGTGFLNPPPDPVLLSKIYKTSGHGLNRQVSFKEIMANERKFPNSTIDSMRMAKCARMLDKSKNFRALDIGSGYGFYTKALTEQGYSTISINPGKYENKVFEEMTGYRPIPIFFQDYQEKSASFGVILMSQVLEHIVEPKQAIQKTSILLAKSGIFACAVPNFHSFRRRILGIRDNACLWVPEHVNYFTVEGLKRMFEANRLKIVHQNQVTRLRYDIFSRRSPVKSICFILEFFTKYAQIPLNILVNMLGMGVYINVYARKY